MEKEREGESETARERYLQRKRHRKVTYREKGTGSIALTG
jgi:hypothetical protein